MKKHRDFIIFFIVFIMGISLFNSISVSAGTVKRIYGSDRYKTSLAISGQFSTAEYAVIVTGSNYPDALSATPLAGIYSAPILLVNGSSLDSATSKELKRLKVKKVFIVGGTGVVSEKTATQIKSLGISVERIAGSNRYETSYKVAKKVREKTGKDGVFVTTGSNFADALSIGPVAAFLRIPIVLADKGKPVTAISSNTTYVIGGEAVVPSSSVSKLKNIKRIYGKDRYETNKKIIEYFNIQFNFYNAYVATGANFPDALAGGALAAKNRQAIILTASSPTKSTTDIIKNNSICNLTILGGKGVVSENTVRGLDCSNLIETNNINNEYEIIFTLNRDYNLSLIENTY